MLATTLLSQGTPMILAGDEMGRTQHGNNNAYCQDNEISWVNWNVPERATVHRAFVQRLTSLRHQYPILRRVRFFTGDLIDAAGSRDITWINASGAEMRAEDWSDGGMRCFGMVMDGRAQPTGVGRRGEDATMLMILNGHHDLVRFTLPLHPGGKQWLLLIDTNLPQHERELAPFPFGSVYDVTARSLLLFALDPERVAE